MFKFITLSCLLAVSVQCKISPNQAVPYYPQPYPAAYPNVYPQVYSAQPKYNVQPAYVAAAAYPAAAYPAAAYPAAPGSYRQVFVPASPAYNPYYYGYAPYPAYAQAQQYPYSYVQNDGAGGASGAGAAAAAGPQGWAEYLTNSFWSYVPSYGTQTTSETGESAGAGENAETASNEGPAKGDKPAATQEAPKSGEVASDEQPAQSPSKQFAAYTIPYFGQPQFFGQAPYQQAYDPAKLNAANNGAVSSFLFPKNVQSAVFQQTPQPFADQKYYQAPQANQGTAAQAYQRYLQFQKQHLQGQYQQGQFQQGQFPQQHQDQPFQQQPEQFQQQPEQFQQYDQQPQKDESSVVVDSNVTGLQVNAEGQQQQPQSKVATGSN